MSYKAAKIVTLVVHISDILFYLWFIYAMLCYTIYLTRKVPDDAGPFDNTVAPDASNPDSNSVSPAAQEGQGNPVNDPTPPYKNQP